MKKVRVGKSSAGLGLFAAAPISKGVRIIEYTGERISDAEADRRGGKYLFTLNNDWLIDGKGRENIARYINHSCRPNAYAELTHDEKRVFIFAKRAIAVGEEITYHYGKQYFNIAITKARCRCQHCLKKTGHQPLPRPK